MAVKSLLTGLYDVGVYVGYPGASAFDSNLSQYVAAVGASPGYVDLYIDDTQSISRWISGAQAEAVELKASIVGASVIPVVSVPLISTTSNGLTELQNFAAITSGADDGTWLGIVQAFQAQGYTSIDLRLGEEQNGKDYPWSVSTTAEAQAYIAAFDHISALVHNVAGITVNVIWNPQTVTTSAIPTAATYPGNAYVDIIGVDAYDVVSPLSLYDWSTGAVDATLAQWEANPVNLEHYWTYPDANAYHPTGTGQGFGLADAIAFAQANGKPLAFPEVGAGGASTSPSTDDALFPQYLATTLLSSSAPIAFANIWDSGAYTFSDGSKPNEAAAWAAFASQMNQGYGSPSLIVNNADGTSYLYTYNPTSTVTETIGTYSGLNATGTMISDIVDNSAGTSLLYAFNPSSTVTETASEYSGFNSANGAPSGTQISDVVDNADGTSLVYAYNPTSTVTQTAQEWSATNAANGAPAGREISDVVDNTDGSSLIYAYNPSSTVTLTVQNWSGADASTGAPTGAVTSEIFDYTAGGSSVEVFNADGSTVTTQTTGADGSGTASSITIDLSNLSNTASVSTGLSAASLSFIGAPDAVTLGSIAETVLAKLAPANGVAELANFQYGLDTLDLDLNGAANSVLQIQDTTVNGKSAIALYSSGDPTHGVLLINAGAGMTAANLVSSHITFSEGGAIIM